MQNKRNEGTGDMASKDASFKSYVVAKCGITALNMETMTLSRRLARSLPVSQLNRTHDLNELQLAGSRLGYCAVNCWQGGLRRHGFVAKARCR